MTNETDSERLLAMESRRLNSGDAFYELSQEFTDRISRRAYELYLLRGSLDGHDREDWLQAASEILMNVPVDLTENEIGLTIRADVPGFDENDLEVRVAPRSVCITGKRMQPYERTERNSRDQTIESWFGQEGSRHWQGRLRLVTIR